MTPHPVSTPEGSRNVERTTPRLRVFDSASRAEPLRDANVIEWVWPDGRTVQVYVAAFSDTPERVCIRTWPKDPTLVGEDESFDEGTSIYFDMFKVVRHIEVNPR